MQPVCVDTCLINLLKYHLSVMEHTVLDINKRQIIYLFIYVTFCTGKSSNLKLGNW